MDAVRDVGLAELKEGLRDGSILLVDVREPHEFAAASIPGSVLMPLSGFDPGALPDEPGRRVVFSCRSGKRSLTAIELARAAGRDLREHYPGGILGWTEAGEPVESGRSGLDSAPGPGPSSGR